MKKFALIVIIAALSTFMLAAVASAGNGEWKGFHGVYAMTGSGSCLFSFTTLVPGLPPDPPPAGLPNPWGAPVVQEGIWTFELNGSGTFHGTQFGMALPPYPTPNATPVDLKFDFDYYVTHEGKITINVIPATFIGTYLAGSMSGNHYHLASEMTMYGRISIDHKSLTLTNGDIGTNEIMEVQTLTLPNGNPLYGICNVGRALIRVDE
jgi:hypothetical protein